MRFRARATALLAWSLLLPTQPALAQASAADATERYDRGVHIVRPGENLHVITKKYLGDASLWRENWKLNQQIEDPNALTPGERIVVLVEQRRSVPTARLRTVSGAVEGKPAPISWNPSHERDLMLEEDGLRTGNRSSTEMEFQDGTRVLMTEDSVVYLRRQGRRLTGVSPRAVEIVQGQAEVAARQAPGTRSEVEILVGGTRAVSRPDESGVAQTRARRAEDDAAKVMVYEGGGEVQSGGQKVAVARGMGTSVERGRPPGPPEKLLPAPEGLAPEPGTRLDFNNVEFAWQPVAVAASYTFELCRDAECVQLVERHVGLAEPQWKPPPMTPGEYHWRVTAVSASGLDGYPSAGAGLVVFGGPDRVPPRGELVVSGRQIHRGGRLLVDERVQIEPRLEDDQTGVAGWRPLIDGEEVTVERWSGPWPDGTYSVAVMAADRVGNEGQIEARQIVVDARPPVLWVTAETAHGGEVELSWQERCSWLQRSRWIWLSRAQCRYLRRAPRRWLKRGWSWLEVSTDQQSWSPMLVAGSQVHRELTHRSRKLPVPAPSVVVRGDHPQLFVRAAGGAALAPADGTTASDILRIRAVDAGAGVERLELGIVGEADGVRLWVAASDVFGHRQELSWRPQP